MSCAPSPLATSCSPKQCASAPATPSAHSAWPLGSLVKLNNNTIGRVVGANKLYPTRPLVETLLDHRGNRVKDPQLVHLEEEPMLYIVDPAIDESVLEEK